MPTLLRTIAVAALVTAPALAPLSAQAADPILGTWELNVAKSKFTPGPAPKSETRVYVLSGKEIKATQKAVDASGKAVSGTWTVNCDGTDRPSTGSEDSDALSVKCIDSHTTEFTQKKAGKIVGTGTRLITKDGKSMTITTKGTNAKGQAFNTVEVFDKK